MSDTDLIKDKIDIVDFVGEYVQLRPAGVRHKAVCPFHQEKSPSFMVSRERQSWHCFGCGKGGDIFSFLQEMEGMEFIEALKYLAGRAGIELTTRGDDGRSDQKARLKEINTEAARFFHKFLMQMAVAEDARAYLVERGLSEQTIEDWQIGYIPDQWDLLTQYLLKKGRSIDDLVSSGLTIKRDGADMRTGRGFYDRFRGRVMFPIWDIHGSVVGFTGRILVETEHSGGKYVNTPETPLFDKSRVVFGLNKAKQAIKQEGIIVMVEGQMDVIACHQAGMKHVIATSGTALTEHHIQLLKRYAEDLYIAFDADKAGEAAAKRGIEMALEAGMHVRVIRIPEGAGKDPDECVRKHKETWFESVRNAQDIIAWYLDQAMQGKDVSEPRAKQTVVQDVLPQIARIPFAVERDHWLQELARRIHVEVDVLREDLTELKHQRPQRSAARSQPTNTMTAPVDHAEPDRYEKLFERFIQLVLKSPPLFARAAQGITPAQIPNRFTSLYAEIKKQYTTTGLSDISALRHAIPYDDQHRLDVLLLKADEEFSDTDTLAVESDAILQSLSDEWKKKRRAQILTELRDAEQIGDQTKVIALLEEFRIL